jgi:hypothetical protein
MLNIDQSFRALVQTWERHEVAARKGNIAQLAQARVELDAARLTAARARRTAA